MWHTLLDSARDHSGQQVQRVSEFSPVHLCVASSLPLSELLSVAPLQVDIFAFGMCLLEVVTGLPPWQAETSIAGRSNHAAVEAAGGNKPSVQMPPMKCMQLVVAGKRPALPTGMEPKLATLVGKCWAQAG